MSDPPQMAREYGTRHEQGENPERQVDVEDPAPGQVRHAETADEWSDHGGHGEHGAEQAHVTPPVAGRHHVADDRLRADHQSAAAEALHGPESDELGHRVTEAGERRPDHED